MVTANPRAFRKVTRKAAYGVYATASKGRGGSISLQEIVWTTARTIAATGRAGKGKIEHCGYCGSREAMPGGSVKGAHKAQLCSTPEVACIAASPAIWQAGAGRASSLPLLAK